MSIVKPKNFSYIRGPKGDKGDRGEPGNAIANSTGRITYNSATKTIGFNENGLATTLYVETAINNLVNGAPLILDTLSELATAINNDANFVTNITTNINSKLSLSGGTMTGSLVLDSDPVTDLGAATKQYVDAATSSITIDSTTDVPEGTNLYYTTARFDSRLATKSTTNLTEGTNLYYTTARANTDFDSRLATKSTTNLAEGTNLYYTDARTRAAITVSGNLSYNSTTGVISYSTPTTDGITEGTNHLYFTTARARTSISASGDLNYNNGTGVISYTTPFIPTDISQLTDTTGLLISTSLPDGTLVDGGTY